MSRGRPIRAVATLATLGLAACSSPARVTSSPAPPPGPDAGVDAPAPVRPPPPRWLRGSTHVHAAPSGDSSTDVPAVIAWYEAHGYDFIVLTDHNRVTTLDGTAPAAAAAVRAPDTGAAGLVVLAGIELTYNPGVCDPPPPAVDGKCRIHVNGLGMTVRPEGRVEWADRAATARLDMYRAATRWIDAGGGLVQLNHPQWHWGMTPELLRALVGDGARLMEIANTQFARWNAGGDGFPSTEALWDDALGAGLTLWGVASDDAHDYGASGGKYPAGGGWIMVDAARTPAAILAALHAGHFYASTGVSLTRAAVWDGALEVEVADASPGAHVIRFIGAGGRVLDEVHGRTARFALPSAPGYVRAVVERDDGARAWVQPARP